MQESQEITRRAFIRTTTAAAGGLLLAGCTRVVTPSELSRAHPKKAASETEEEVSPAEDLMREHGVLKRILLIYEEAIGRLDTEGRLPPTALAEATGIVRAFIEDYHEKLEEDFLFPRFRKANKRVDLVEVLLQQHKAGRRLTDTVLRLTATPASASADDRHKLAHSLRQFIRMYNPHAAREDTVLFPAFRDLVAVEEYEALGEQFEHREHELFGEDGFEKMVSRVAAIEKSLGIYDLEQFTPRA